MHTSSSTFQPVNEIACEVTQEADRGFSAECLTKHLHPRATWAELRANVKEAVEAFYFDGPKPAGARLHLVRDEMLTLG